MVKAKISKFMPPYLVYHCAYNDKGDFRITGHGFSFIIRFDDICYGEMQSATSDLVDFLDTLFERFDLEKTRCIKVVLDMVKSDHYFCLMESERLIEMVKLPFTRLSPFYYAAVVRFFAYHLTDDEIRSIFKNAIGDGYVTDYIKSLEQNEL